MFREDKKNIQKKKILFSVFSFLLFAGFFFHFGLGESFPFAYAQEDPGSSWNPLTWLGNSVSTAFKWLLYGIFVLVTWIASVAVTLFGWAVDPNYISGTNGFLNRQVIYDLWKFVRDFFNLFFILVLLFVAFCTIFHIEKYHYKKILLNLVIMALLVNFSFPISRFLIDATNVPMYFFLNQALTDPANPGQSLGTALKASQLETIMLPGKVSEMGVSHLLAAIVFVFIFSFTLLILAVMFVIRLIALIILVIFSSAGFACSFIPGLEKYSGQWWETFWKYALFGPAAALMLMVALKFMASTGADFARMKNVAIPNSGITDPGFIASMAFFMVPIILLWFAMGLANSMSIAGASTVTGWGQSFMKWSAKTPALWMGRKYEKAAVSGFGFKRLAGVSKWLAPTAAYHGFGQWRERQHELDRKPVTQAGAEISDIFGRLSGDHTDHAFKNFTTNVAKEQKEIASISTNSDYVIHELIAGLQSKDDDKVVGALQILAQNNDFNDMMHVIGEIEKKTGIKLGANGEEADAEMSSENTKEVLKNMMLKAGLSPEMAAKNMLNISNTAIAAGNVGMAGAAKLGEDGKFRITTAQEQADVAAAKLQNLETQARQRTLHHNAIFKEKAKTKYQEGHEGEKGYEMEKDGKRVVQYGGINDTVGYSVLDTITTADIEEARRSRDDLKREVAVRMEVIRNYTEGEDGTDLDGNIVLAEDRKALKEEMERAMQSNPNLKGYFEKIYMLQTGKTYINGPEFDKLPLASEGKKSGGGAKEPDRSPTPLSTATGPITIEGGK